MDTILHLAGNYWWLIFPFGGVIGGWFGAIGRYNEKRRRDKIELARIKSDAKTQRMRLARADKAQITKTMARHDAVDERWFGYELDLATLIEYPTMIDMREPLTLGFHRAKLRADDLRPASADAPMDPERYTEYRDAVGDYTAAFDAAEREARRRKQGDFTPTERESLDRARKLVTVASDEAATPAERQAAYRRARQELDGLIDVPTPAAERLERGVAGEIERGEGA